MGYIYFVGSFLKPISQISFRNSSVTGASLDQVPRKHKTYKNKLYPIL